MDRLTEALKNLLKPEEIKEVAKAVEEMIDEVKTQLDGDYQTKLEEAYTAHQQELKEAEETAHVGYSQAFEIIADQEARIDTMKREFQEAIDEGFGEAFTENEKLRAEKDGIEMELYKEFDQRLLEMQEFMVEKIDTFMTLQEGELYEMAFRKAMSDPRMMEHKVVLDKIVELISDRLGEEDFTAANASRLSEAFQQVEDLKAQLRIVEHKSFNLTRQNTKLVEQVRQAQDMINESTKIERKERASKRGTVSGRGQQTLVNETVVPEYQNNQVAKQPEEQSVNETVDAGTRALVLAGLVESL